MLSGLRGAHRGWYLGDTRAPREPALRDLLTPVIWQVRLARLELTPALYSFGRYWPLARSIISVRRA